MNSKIVATNKRSYPCPLVDGISNGYLNVTAVLVAGEIGDYAVYIGGGRDAEWVARHGSKLSFIEARCHFLSLIKEKYRE